MSHLVIGVVGVVSVVAAIISAGIGARFARPVQRRLLGLVWLACLAAILLDGIEVVGAGRSLNGIIAEPFFLWYGGFAIIALSGLTLYNQGVKTKDVTKRC